MAFIRLPIRNWKAIFTCLQSAVADIGFQKLVEDFRFIPSARLFCLWSTGSILAARTLLSRRRRLFYCPLNIVSLMRQCSDIGS